MFLQNHRSNVTLLHVMLQLLFIQVAFSISLTLNFGFDTKNTLLELGKHYGWEENACFGHRINGWRWSNFSLI